MNESRSYTRRAHCKVNLTLDVMAPRPDGFHDLESITIKLSPHDVLTAEFTPQILLLQGMPSRGYARRTFDCSDASLPKGDANLVVYAFDIYHMSNRATGGKGTGWQIYLEKRLPAQAGLGGGSSDAAAMLSILDEVYSADTPMTSAILDFREDALLRIAARVGSDVPLFLIPGPVRMTGRGEIVEPLSVPLPTLHGVLVKPRAGVPTGPAYQLLDAVPNRVPGKATERLLAVLTDTPNDLAAIAAAMGNDFEQAVLPAFPEVGEAHGAVQEAGALRALLCGSGAAIFGLAESKAHAETMAQALCATGRYPWVEVAESLP